MKQYPSDPVQFQNGQTDLGALTPQDALTYMKNTKNLVIVDVAAKRWFRKKHFADAVNIPIEDIRCDTQDARYLALPSGRPVLLHCRMGAIVPGAYRRIKALRPDIPQISYICGAPLFDEYNRWYAQENPQGGLRGA